MYTAFIMSYRNAQISVEQVYIYMSFSRIPVSFYSCCILLGVWGEKLIQEEET